MNAVEALRAAKDKPGRVAARLVGSREARLWIKGQCHKLYLISGCVSKTNTVGITEVLEEWETFTLVQEIPNDFSI
jgi:hypothetical protein